MSKSENGNKGGAGWSRSKSSQPAKVGTNPDFSVEKQSGGGDWGDLGRDGAGGNLAEGEGCEHGQEKAERIAPLNEDN